MHLYKGDFFKMHLSFTFMIENTSMIAKSCVQTRLLKIRHLYGIWFGLIPYRLRLDTLSEYPEP